MNVFIDKNGKDHSIRTLKNNNGNLDKLKIEEESSHMSLNKYNL